VHLIYINLTVLVSHKIAWLGKVPSHSPDRASSTRSKRGEKMRHEAGLFARYSKAWTVVFAVVAASAVFCGNSTAHADEAQAKALFKGMSDYLSGQKIIAFDYDSNLEVVTKENQKLGLASSGTLTLNRPDKLRATRKGGFADVELVFDGETLTLLGKSQNVYAQVQAPGTIDQLVDVIRDKYHRPVPAADLLMSNPYQQLMPLVVDTKDLGSGVIRGIECDHLAFRTKEVDLQIWIAQGEHPYPCRYVITSSKMRGSPQYTIDVRTWKTGAEVPADTFSVTIPPEARKINPDDLPNFDELPAMFAPKS
jgi:hypothetical protein